MRLNELFRLRSLLLEFDRLHLNPMEFAYLKLISIFNPNSLSGKNRQT